MEILQEYVKEAEACLPSLLNSPRQEAHRYRSENLHASLEGLVDAAPEDDDDRLPSLFDSLDDDDDLDEDNDDDEGNEEQQEDDLDGLDSNEEDEFEDEEEWSGVNPGFSIDGEDE